MYLQPFGLPFSPMVSLCLPIAAFANFICCILLSGSQLVQWFPTHCTSSLHSKTHFVAGLVSLHHVTGNMGPLPIAASHNAQFRKQGSNNYGLPPRALQVVLLPAVLQVVLRLGVLRAVRRPGALLPGVHARCRMRWLLDRIPCHRRCPCLPLGIRISAGVGQGCSACCGREVEDPLHPNSEGYRRLLRHRLRAVPPCSPWALGDAGGLVHPHRCR